MRYRFTFLAILATVMAACGFTPLHGQRYQSSVAVDLSALSVSVAGDSLVLNDTRAVARRYGEMLKAEIESQVNPDGARSTKRFLLDIRYSEAGAALFVNPDGTASRGDLTYSSTYTITRLADGKEVASGSIQAISSYGTSPNADYASYVSIEDARKRGMLDLAQSYKLRMAALLPTLNDPNATSTPVNDVLAPTLQPVHSNEIIR